MVITMDAVDLIFIHISASEKEEKITTNLTNYKLTTNKTTTINKLII